MTGLFGILDLRHNSSSAEAPDKAFMKMAEVLRHHAEDRLEQMHVSGSNLMIGRIGLAGHNPHPWPTGPDGSETSVHLFVSGPLLERGPSETMRQLPDGDAVREWQGFFSAVLTEPMHRTTLLVADRRASNPIFYIQTNGQLFFAPEVKALLPSLSGNKEIDLEALGTYLAQGYLLGDQTLFKAVRRLQGGELLRVENGRVVKETYWRFSPGSSSDGASQTDLEHELGQLLNAAARKHIGDPAKAIIFLSGGVDSRGILGGALAHVHGEGRKLNTVTWGASQGIKDSDVAVAAAIAHHFNTNHRFIQRKISDFREHFRRVSYLTDGLADSFAFHPYEYQIMIEIRNSGYERVLRGDEIFGWSLSASTTEGAFALANLRRLRDVQGLESIIQPRRYDELCEASDVAVDRALLEALHLSPNQAKDFFYFTHRLQCYLQPISYYKQIELDQRNVLLDDPILDFLAKVPDPLRIDKMLYRRAVARAYPRLARFPIARRPNSEDWVKLLSTQSPVRAYVLEELNDQSSGIWEILDPLSLTKLLGLLEKGSRFRSSIYPRINPRSLARRGFEILAPTLLARIQGQRRARPISQLSVEKIIMRVLVLKHWYDTFAPA